MNKKVLGRGLDALIPQGFKEAVETNSVTEIPIEQVGVNPYQPRKRFDRDKIQSLSDSIQVDGMLQPVVVRRKGERYELIMGERRLQAARLAGVITVPAVVKEAQDIDALRLALVENLQREDLNPLEVAEAFHSLVEQFGLSQSELARLVGKDRSSVANTLRLLSLPDEVRDLVRAGDITEGHARALLSLTTRSEQIQFAKKIVKDNLNVREIESLTGMSRTKTRARKAKKEKPAHIVDLENTMSRHLATRVTVDEKRGGKGKITIEFYSHEEFERLVDLMHIPLPR
jgi:ParB family chromosome partitioning protein